jgi:hypothetical protein
MFSRKIVYGDLTSMNFNALLIFTSFIISYNRTLAWYLSNFFIANF